MGVKSGRWDSMTGPCKKLATSMSTSPADAFFPLLSHDSTYLISVLNGRSTPCYNTYLS